MRRESVLAQGSQKPVSIQAPELGYIQEQEQREVPG